MWIIFIIAHWINFLKNLLLFNEDRINYKNELKSLENMIINIFDNSLRCKRTLSVYINLLER